ncbi:MAG TPA: hypothetical protein VG273_00725 [Bryobacteraceae bacterium]|jgi:hypothetical protein|nr:hypothetical protein [Bryobacteraceae bacterium]
MRPLHIGLLVVGAALAGGLAVKMTELQPIPIAAATPAPVSAPAEAPPAAVAQEAKPSPMPDLPAANPPAVTPLVAAPPPAYEEPAPAKTTIRINKPKPAPARPLAIDVAGAKPLPAYNSPPQFVGEPATATTSSPTPEPAVQKVSTPAPVVLPPRRVTLWTGTQIAVRVDESLSSDRNAGGDTFNGSLAEPLVASGLVIAERGARVRGRIVNSQKAGRFSGTSFIELGLAGITTSDGQDISISTDPWAQRASSSGGESAAKIGGGAALGAVIGAIAGGGKGAAIGAGAGGAAGVGAVAASRPKAADVPAETIVRFRLASAVTITERR